MFMVFIGMSDLDPDLFKRYAEGRCSQEEQLQVEAWLNDDPVSENRSVDDPKTRMAMWAGLMEKASAGATRKTRARLFYAMAAACVLLIGGLLLFAENTFNRNETDSTTLIRYTAPAARVVELKLPDHSTITLAGGSSIEYPKVFSNANRKVNFIKGEAFFAIQHDASRPFLVNASGTQIRVLGTRFNVNQSSNENLRVTLTQGSVSFKTQDQSETILTPGQELTYDLIKHGAARISKVDTAYVTSWSAGILWFKDTPMQEVLHKLERHYGVTIFVQGSPDLKVPMTARFDHQPLSKVLTLIENSTSLRFKQENNKVIIY